MNTGPPGNDGNERDFPQTPGSGYTGSMLDNSNKQVSTMIDDRIARGQGPVGLRRAVSDSRSHVPALDAPAPPAATDVPTTGMED
jgi:hypothetical protein